MTGAHKIYELVLIVLVTDLGTDKISEKIYALQKTQLSAVIITHDRGTKTQQKTLMPRKYLITSWYGKPKNVDNTLVNTLVPIPLGHSGPYPAFPF